MLIHLRNWILVLLFVAFIITPLIGQFTGFCGAQYIQEVELRFPNTLPLRPKSMEDLAHYPEKYEAYFNDHFGFRTELVALDSLTFYRLLNSTNAPNVIIGKDDWLFERRTHNLQDECRGVLRYREEELTAWIATMEKRQQWFSDHGAEFMIIVPPNKHSIYPEFLPDWMASVGQRRLDQLIERINETSTLDLLDLRPALLRAKERTEKPLYHKTDTHWNYRGAFVAYQEIIKHIQRRFPGTHMIKEKDFKLVSEPGKAMNLGRMLNLVDWLDEEKISIIPKVPLQLKAVYSIQCNRALVSSISDIENQRIIMYTVSLRPESPKVMIFRDSFTNALTPFLAESFRETLIRHHQNNRIFPDLFQWMKPDLILYIISERALYFAPPEGENMDLYPQMPKILFPEEVKDGSEKKP
ncbi:MAG: hypothetical protein ABIK28_08600 [Planctomycetota bacterium]